MARSPAASSLQGNIAAPRAGAFRSRVVRTLKIVLPLVAIGIVAFVALWPREQARLPIKVEKIDVAADKIAMQNSSYRGTTDEGEPFTVSAARISQTLDRPDLFEMEQIKAAIGSDAMGTVLMTAPTGRYDHAARQLTLSGLIAITSDKGYSIEAGTTAIDLGLNQASSDQPVRAFGPMGEIRAGNMKIYERANRLVFGGGVRLIYRVAAQD